MRLSNLAARDAAAQKRIVAAAEVVAHRLGIDVDVEARIGRRGDQRVRAMKQREELADLLEAAAERLQPPLVSLADLAAVPGVGEATLAKIEDHINGDQ